jgi:hypothetical protein
MIINPLTGKSIKASGKLAKQLYQMHKEKRIKLKRQDIQTMKECMVNKQHGGTCSENIQVAEYLNNDVMALIGKRLNFVTKTRLAATSTNYVKVFIDEIGDQKKIIESGSLEQRINMLKGDLFSCYTLGDFQHHTALGKLVKECATFEQGPDFFSTYLTLFDHDSNRLRDNIEEVAIKKECENVWILGAISACIDDPHELITIYDHIYDNYETNRGQTGYNKPHEKQKIPTVIKETSATLLVIRKKEELSDIEKEEEYDTISKKNLAGLKLDTIINYLQLFTLHNMQKHGMY